MNDELTIRSGIHDVMPTVFGYITVGMALRDCGENRAFIPCS